MDNNPTPTVADAVRAAIDETFAGSVRAASIEAAIPYATLDRRLRDGEDFRVSELRRLAVATDRDATSFLGGAA